MKTALFKTAQMPRSAFRAIGCGTLDDTLKRTSKLGFTPDDAGSVHRHAFRLLEPRR